MKPVLIIAEIGQAHDGSLGILHSFIDAAAQTGVDAIKFQTHIAVAESSPEEAFRIKFSYEDQNRFAYWERMELSAAEWAEIKKHCEAVHLEFMSSPFSNAAVDLLEGLGIRRYKIASGEVNNFLLLQKVAQTGKEIILSSGMSNYEELDAAIKFLQQFGNSLSVLQCTTAYPTPPEAVGLNLIPELKEKYRIPVGLSDHSGTIYASLAAVALGAEIIEVHLTYDKMMFGPDAIASLTVAELKQLVTGIRFLETTLNNPVPKKDDRQFQELKTIFGKSLAVNRALPKGHQISFADLEGKKPSGQGIPARDFESVIGKRLIRNMAQYEFLKGEDLE